MATIRLFLDARRPKAGGRCPLKLAVTHERMVRYVPLDIDLEPAVWDAAASKVSRKHPMAAAINGTLQRVEHKAMGAMMEWLGAGCQGGVRRLLVEVKAAVKGVPAEPEAPEVVSPTLESPLRGGVVDVLRRLAALKKPSTRLTYERTLKHVVGYAGAEAPSLRWEDISRSWLMGWDAYMAGAAPSPNARAIHMRNLRAAMNFAIDEGATSAYAFRRYRIKTVATAKRSLAVEDLRRVMTCALDDEWLREYVLVFRLSFLLVGANPVDLLGLRPGDVQGGRVVYNRSKTGRLYSILLEPEAAAIVEELRGRDHLLRVMDGRKDYLQWVRQADHALGLLGTSHVNGRRREGTPWYPELTMYWARHSWATIASELDIPKETIAAALGHGGNTVTDIYIDYNLRKVDEANRRVIDWVLYGRR